MKTFFVLTKTGTPTGYQVTLKPGGYSTGEELITVTVQVDDFSGNSLAPVTWSFTTATAPTAQTIILHPSDVVSTDGFTAFGGDWPDVLDSDDGDATYAILLDKPGFDVNFYVAMDDTGLGSATILDFTIHVVARHTYHGGQAEPKASQPGNIDIGFRTGTGTIWNGTMPLAVSGSEFDYVASQTFTVDSDGGPLDLNDIENLEATVKWFKWYLGTPNWFDLRVTEVYVEVTYYP